MLSAKDCVPVNVASSIRKALGCEEALRRLWPVVVGGRLANNTRPKSLRGGVLTLAVPDRTWLGSLGSMENMIRDAVNRFCGGENCKLVEFVEDRDCFGAMPGAAARHSYKAARLNLPLDAIEDDQVRKKFLASAAKYFAWQEARPK